MIASAGGPSRRRSRPDRVDSQRGGQRRADQDLACPGRGRPVGGIGSEPHRDPHRQHGEPDGDAPDAARQRTRGRTADEEREQDGRPEPVELLLDRQRPVVGERRCGAAEAVQEVGVAVGAAQALPVGDLEDRAGNLAAQRVGGREPSEPGGSDDAHDARQARRQEPAQTAGVEGSERDPAGTGMLGEEQPGDEEPGQREEDAHADVAAPHPRHVGVEQEHDDHGDGAHPVERRLVVEAGARQRVHHRPGASSRHRFRLRLLGDAGTSARSPPRRPRRPPARAAT